MNEKKVAPAEKPTSLATTLISLTQSANQRKIKEFFEANPDFVITKVKDARLYTILHMACLSNQYDICKTFLNHAQSTGASKNEIKVWVNSRTDEGFTAIHFASFKGNLRLIKLLEENEADISVKNYKGLSVLHIAAQGDQPISLAYFVDKGMSLTQKDDNGSTPLHWAAFFGMENATNYLTAWGCPVNELDREFECTPLHLAVNSGNFKTVRRLLTKGADRRIKNKERKLPIDLAKENEYESIMDLLKEESKLGQCLSVKARPGSRRSRRLLFTFLTLFLLIGICSALFLFPFVLQHVWVFGNSVLIMVTLLTFIFVWLTSPGFIVNKDKGQILKLLMNNDPHLICPECVIVKPERSRHCDLCKRCISVYDHHCPWVDNCIGAKNYKFFVAFIFLVLITLISLTVLAGFHVGGSPDSQESNLYAHIIKLHSETLFNLKEITCTLIFIATISFVIPLIGLNLVHFKNLFTGKTTNERFRYAAEKGARHSSSQLSFDQSLLGKNKPTNNNGCLFQCWSNCTSLCYTNARNEKYVTSKELF